MLVEKVDIHTGEVRFSKKTCQVKDSHDHSIFTGVEYYVFYTKGINYTRSSLQRG